MGTKYGGIYWLGQSNTTKIDPDVAEMNFLKLITEAELASRIRPDNVVYHKFLNEYRWCYLTYLARQTDPSPRPQFNDSLLKFARQAVIELQKGRLLCPTYGPTVALAGYIEVYYTDPKRGEDDILLASRLNPHDPATCFIAGELDAVRGDIDGATEHLSRAIRLSPGLADDAIAICLDEAHSPEMAEKLLQSNATLLLQLADTLDHRKIAPAISSDCRNRAFVLLSAATLHPDHTPGDLGLLADLYTRRGDPQSAANCYVRALEDDYAQPVWHLKLAQCLEKLGRSHEAYEEAERCLRYSPGDPEARELADTTAP
jgi:tetratricopeptide (TPR) repeat protein